MIGAFAAWGFIAPSLARREVPFASYQPSASRPCQRTYAAWCRVFQSACWDLQQVFFWLSLSSVVWYSWATLSCLCLPSRWSVTDALIKDQLLEVHRQITSERHQSPLLLDRMVWIHLRARKWEYRNSRYLPCSCNRLRWAPQVPHTTAFHNLFALLHSSNLSSASQIRSRSVWYDRPCRAIYFLASSLCRWYSFDVAIR